MNNASKGLVIIGISAILFFAAKPIYDKKMGKTSTKLKKERQQIEPPVMDAKELEKSPMATNAFIALKAYISAWNDNETEEQLNSLNHDLYNEFKLTVFHEDKELLVKDDAGNIIAKQTIENKF